MRSGLIDKKTSRGFRKNPQHGFTLIELMVGLLLSAFLLAAAINTFITTKRSYESKEEIARLQENVNFSFETMRQTINLAEETTATANTELTVGYKGRTGLSDCLGSTATDTSTVYLNRFYISSEKLVCEVSTRPAAGGTATVVQTQNLIDNISAMKIQFGIDTTSPTADGVVDSYSPTTVDMSSSSSDGIPTNFSQVLSTRIYLRLIVDKNPLKTQDVDFIIAMYPRILGRVAL